MFEYSIPIRWADIDQLNHVNNVVYAEYAAQARGELVAKKEVSDARVRSIEVTYRRQIFLGLKPVRVLTTLDDDATDHDIRPTGAGEAFATVRLGTRASDLSRSPVSPAFDLALRPRDRALDGGIDPVRFFELCQEARIRSFSLMMPNGMDGSIVLAHVNARIGEPVPEDMKSIGVSMVVSHVGRSSFSVEVWFADGQLGSARATMVGFDLDTQVTRPLSDNERAALERYRA